MGTELAFWIVCGCLIFLLCKSLWWCFRAVRKSETKQEVNNRRCGIVEFLFAADEHFKPKMYIPMSPSDIDKWKEKHQAELAANEEEENKANADTEVKDE